MARFSDMALYSLVALQIVLPFVASNRADETKKAALKAAEVNRITFQTSQGEMTMTDFVKLRPDDNSCRVSLMFTESGRQVKNPSGFLLDVNPDPLFIRIPDCSKLRPHTFPENTKN